MSFSLLRLFTYCDKCSGFLGIDATPRRCIVCGRRIKRCPACYLKNSLCGECEQKKENSA
jgi:hypothetical protein